MSCIFRQTVLPNGLRIAAEIDPDAHTAALGFFVKTGSRDENPAAMGVSHFLEHMMFKGTARRSADDVNREFDEIGAVYNAFTSQEMTAFWAHVIPESLPPALDILSDIMRPALRAEDFDTERGVILEEIAMYQDIPFWRLYEATLEKYFGSHPLSHRVLGTNGTITDLQRDVMQVYFEDRYSPDNTICVLAGAIDFDAIVAAVEKQCGHWKRTGTKRAYPDCRPHGEAIDLEDAATNRHYLLMVTPGPAIADEQRYAAAMLGGALGDEEGSLLYWALVDPGIAEEAQVGYDGRDGLGEFYVYASCPPDRATQVEDVINEQIANCKELVTAEDLERLKHKTATQVTLAGERPAGRMKRLGRLLTDIGEYQTLEEELARIEAVGLDDVCDVFDAYGFEPRAVGRLHPPVEVKA